MPDYPASCQKANSDQQNSCCDEYKMLDLQNAGLIYYTSQLLSTEKLSSVHDAAFKPP